MNECLYKRQDWTCDRLSEPATVMKNNKIKLACSLVILFAVSFARTGYLINLHAETTLKPPPVEAPATTAREEIVTGVCTFGDCPVLQTTQMSLANSTEAVKESLTTVNLTKPTKNLTTAEAAENKGSRGNSETETPITSQNEETTSQNEAVADSATTEPETEPLTAEPETKEEPATEPAESAAIYSASYFRNMGVIWWNGWRWTWYSERVLPGTGLNIPGRHTEGGYVRDGERYICLASDALDYGAVIETPFGTYGKVYDSGCGYDTIDVYVGW